MPKGEHGQPPAASTAEMNLQTGEVERGKKKKKTKRHPREEGVKDCKVRSIEGRLHS